MKMTIANKLYAAIGILAAVFVALGVFSYQNSKKMGALLTEVDTLRETQSTIMPRILDHFRWADALAIDTIMYGKEFTGKLDPTQCKLGVWYGEFKPPREVEEEFRKIDAPHHKVHATAEKILAALKSGDQEKAKSLFSSETKPALAEAQTALTALRDKFKWLVGQKTAELHDLQESSDRLTMSVYALLALALAVGAVLFLVNPLRSGFRAITSWSQTMAEGDLTKSVAIHTDDELGDLAQALNVLSSTLKGIIRNVADAVTGLNSQVASVSTSVEEQAAISTEQSASVAEITSTMEEFSSSSTQIAEHSTSVVDIAARTWESSKKGAAAVETVIMKMNEIHADNQNSIHGIVELGKKSKEITKVMEIINNIADQTKLIAFNAALEASSAGEAGKRFGVVAVEIRRLADSVMESTGEIEAKISEIQESINRLVIASEKGSKGIQEGMEHTNQTGAILMDIVNGAQSTQEAAKQISLSTQQQKTASSQVVTALREIVAGSAQTSASIKQISTVSRQLKQLADNLKGHITKFKLD